MAEDRRPLESSLSILILTVLAYSSAFAYDAGYLDGFSVPASLARVDLKNLVVCAAVLISGGFLIAEGIIKIWPRSWHPAIQLLLADFIVWYGVILWIALRVHDRRTWILLGVWALLIALFKVGIPLLYTDKATFADKLVAAIPKDSNRGVWEIVDRLVVDRRFSRAILVGVIAAAVSYVVGEYHQQRTTDFLVSVSTSVPCAVIREHGDRLLCAEFDPNTRQLTGGYRFLALDGKLQLKHVGRLRTEQLDQTL